MEKYGYKNISSSDELQKSSGVNFGPVDMKKLTTDNFVHLNSVGNWGMPGQTRHFVKTLDELTGAQENASKVIIKERKPKGFVGW